MKTTLILAIAIIFLPFAGAEETKAPAAAPAFVEWVNKCDDGFILDVKGIGKVKLAAIKAGRPYADQKAILAIKGIGKVTLQAMRDYFANLK